MKISNLLLERSNKIIYDNKIDGISGIEISTDKNDYDNLFELYKNYVKNKKSKLNLNTPILSYKNLVQRAIIINLFQFNFWNTEDNKNSDKVVLDSQKLIELIDDTINYENFHSTLENLEKYLNLSNFKMKETYLKYLKDFIIFSKTEHYTNFIDMIVYEKLSDDLFITELGNYLPNVFGNDKFYKREILALYFIYLAKERFNYNLIRDNFLFPIDYRIPSSLIDLGIIKINDRFRNTLDTCIFKKDDDYDLIIRASAYKALYNFSLKHDIICNKLDEFLFWYSKDNNLKIHKTDTTDY